MTTDLSFSVKMDFYGAEFEIRADVLTKNHNHSIQIL